MDDHDAKELRQFGCQLLMWAVALIWVLGLVAALTIPPTPLAGIQTQHLPVLSTALAIAVGVVLYFGLNRGRLKRGGAGPPTTPKQNHD